MKMLNAWTITNAILFVFNKPLTLGSKYFLLLCTFKTLICSFETILAHSKHFKNYWVTGSISIRFFAWNLKIRNIWAFYANFWPFQSNLDRFRTLLGNVRPFRTCPRVADDVDDDSIFAQVVFAGAKMKWTHMFISVQSVPLKKLLFTQNKLFVPKNFGEDDKCFGPLLMRH